jgi:hypothetical protein
MSMDMDISPVPLFDFNWNDFSHFDEINQSLDVLNQNDDVNAQLDQLMNMNFLSELDMEQRSSPVLDGSSAICPPNTLSRIPTSQDIPVKGIHSFPPPSKYTWKKLLEWRWQELNDQLSLEVFPVVHVNERISITRDSVFHKRVWSICM